MSYSGVYLVDVKSMSGEKKLTSVRVLADQYKRLSNDVKTPEAKELGYKSAAFRCHLSSFIIQIIKNDCER